MVSADAGPVPLRMPFFSLFDFKIPKSCKALAVLYVAMLRKAMSVSRVVFCKDEVKKSMMASLPPISSCK